MIAIRHTSQRPLSVALGLVAMVTMVGCDSGSTKSVFKGRTAGAEAFAIARTQDSGGGMLTGASAKNPEDGELVLVDADTGDVFSVFSEARRTYSFAYTSTHLVAVGEYFGIKTADGGNIQCLVVALPLESETVPALCLYEVITSGGGQGPLDAYITPGSAPDPVYFLAITDDIGDSFAVLLWVRWRHGRDNFRRLKRLPGRRFRDGYAHSAPSTRNLHLRRAPQQFYE